MSDDIAVGGPGSTSVFTMELVEEATRLSQLGRELESCQRELATIDRVVGSGILGAADAPISSLRAEQAIDEATAAMGQAREQCETLRHALSVAAEQYEWTDRSIGRLEQHLAAQLGHLLGTIAPVLIAIVLPGVLAAAAGIAAYVGVLPEKTREALFDSVGTWLKRNSTVLTDPLVVTAVSLSAMSADDFGAGMVRLPPHLEMALGDEGLGILGINTSAAVLMGAGGAFGLFRETPVRVTEGVTLKGISKVENVQDRMERIPGDPSQVRIDRHSSPGEPDRFDVYIGGTEDFSPVSTSEPWDLTSNVAAMAGGSNGSAAASYRAVVEAMTLAGIESTSSVNFTGYSGGGLIAAQLAASGDYACDGLMTIAAPDGGVAVPHDIPYIAIRHTDDVVTALGGPYSSSDPLIVQRRVFDEAPSSAEPVMPAHRLTRYIDTASLIDESTNLRLREVLAQQAHPSAASVESTLYHAERVQQ